MNEVLRRFFLFSQLMKLRGIIYIIVFLLLCNSGKAQYSDFFRNSYVSFGAGPNYYYNSNGGGLGAGAELTYGKWLLTSTGLRGSVSAQYAASSKDMSNLIYYAHFDVFFDLLTALRNRNRSDLFRSWIATGVGIVHTDFGDNDFSGLVGLGGDIKISNDWRLYAELDGMIHPSDFDDNKRSSALLTMKFGAVYDIAYNPTRSRSRTETRYFTNDWFFQLALGVCSFNYSGISSFNERMSLMTPVFQFGIGKRLNYLWQIRFNIAGLYAQSSNELFSYYNIDGDLMFDLSGLILKNNYNSFFTVRPYCSAGVVSRLDDQSHFLFSPGVGLQFVMRPFKNHEISLDTRYIVTPPRFAHVEQTQKTLSVGMASLMLSYGYTFSRNSFR